MKTEDLIATLSAAPAPAPLRPARMAGLIGLSIAAPLALFLGLAGVRPDLALAWSNPVVPVKTLLPLSLSLMSGVLLLRLARPEAAPGRLPWLFALPGAVVVVMWLGTYWLRPPETRFAELRPGALAECLCIIPLLSVLPTLAALRIMRQGASIRPGLSAMLAGLTAASGSAAGYSLFCTRDNPLFFLTWYGVAILAVTLVATHLGKRRLTW